jgi:hypothetical protein
MPIGNSRRVGQPENRAEYPQRLKPRCRKSGSDAASASLLTRTYPSQSLPSDHLLSAFIDAGFAEPHEVRSWHLSDPYGARR